MGKESMIWFVREKCTQCHGCEVACRAWRDLDTGVRYRRVVNVWRGDYPEVRNHSVSMGCLHCVDPACAGVCPEDAIVKRDADGLVRVDRERCIGCEACLDACPYDVPQFGPAGTMEKCDLCIDRPEATNGPPCVTSCPGGALTVQDVAIDEKEKHQSTILSWMKR